MAGNKGGQESHETTRRVFQQFLTWLQEKTADVFLVATANSVESLPPELLRPGRIDMIYWVDLPDDIQKKEILGIHLRKHDRNIKTYEKDLDQVITACPGFSGAEIEVLVNESLTRAFSLKHEDLTAEDLVETAKTITPVSKLMETDINKARAWAKERNTKNASIVHETSEVLQAVKGRKVQAS
jgi:SpoVK/Ycf46/Vps4 family AAA+-type ATPase